MSDETRAREAIEKIAKRKVEENIDPNQKKKYAKKLQDLALDHKEMLFGAKVLNDVSKGKFNYDINDNLGVEADTKNKSLKLKFNKKF